MWEEHPDAMRNALARHDAILRRAIESRGGRIVKSTGDGAYAVFLEPVHAVVAAADATRALLLEPWGETGPLRARVGIHSGSADHRDDDYFGPALNRASRLMAAASGGQVVLSRVTAQLVRDALPETLTLLDLGEHVLRGLVGSERVYELAIAGVPSEFPPLRSLDAFPGDLVLPGPSFGRDEPLAGRAEELDQLMAAWDRATTGLRQIALVAGEPGIGKTRLANELSHRIYARRGAVLYGRCDEEGAVPYQPFVEALRPCVHAYEPSALRERLHGLEPDLARVFPELLARLPLDRVPTSGDAEAERYRFFEAVTTLVTGVAASQPTLFVVDDLHWADKPTLLLLRHLIRGTTRAALSLVLCYRDVDLEGADPVSNLLADLRREPGVTRMTLAGLSEDECGTLLRGLGHGEVTHSLVTALHQETGGNPFFLEELLRHLAETDDLTRFASADAHPTAIVELDLPEGVRDVVARRLRRLPSSVNDALAVAAVIGSEFDVALLARAARQPAADILDALDQATDTGLLKPDPVRIGRYAFAHHLVRQALSSSIGTARRAQLHANTGAAMEEWQASRIPPAELARHFTYAIPLVGAHKAIAYTSQAGRDALDEFAFEDAAGHFERALKLLDDHGPPDARARVDLVTSMASALIHVDVQAGMDVAQRAIDSARIDGSPEQFARAVAVFVEPADSRALTAYQVRTIDAAPMSLFDEARLRLGDNCPALRARLRAFEAFKYATNQLHGLDARALAEEAVALARSSADPVTLADALFALAVSLDPPDDIDGRLTLAQELLELDEHAGGRAPAFGARLFASVHLALGDADAFAAEISRLARIGEEMRWLPARVYAAELRVTQALLEGRFDDVRSYEHEFHGYARAYRTALDMYRIQVFQLVREEGGLRNGRPAGRRSEVAVDVLYAWALVSIARLESGDAVGAVGNLKHLAANGFHSGESEGARGPALGMLAEVAASGGDAEHATSIHDLLTPFAGRLLVDPLGLPCVGAADRYLGMLCTLLERWDKAEAHFERALALEERIRGYALVPRTRYWQARLLQARQRPGDDARARAICERVVAETTQLGMQGLRAQADELCAR
jgi:tetratricopeptide (TPR) repeat protein